MLLGHPQHLNLLLLLCVVNVSVEARHDLQVCLVGVEARLVLGVDERSQRKGRTQAVLHQAVGSRLEAERTIAELRQVDQPLDIAGDYLDLGGQVTHKLDARDGQCVQIVQRFTVFHVNVAE